MAREWENDCVGCPQGCVNCGRDRDYEVIYCDVCGDSEEEMFEFEGFDLCEQHLFEAWENKGNAVFNIDRIDDEDLTPEEKEDYLNDLLRDVAKNYLELIELLENEIEWEEFEDDCRIPEEEDY